MGGPSRFPPGRPGLLGVTSTRVRSPPRGRPRLLPGQPPPFPAHPARGRGWREGAQGPGRCWAGVGPGIGFADCQAPAVALRSCRDGIGGLLPGLGTSRDLGTGGSGTCQASPSVMWPLVGGSAQTRPVRHFLPNFPRLKTQPRGLAGRTGWAYGASPALVSALLGPRPARFQGGGPRRAAWVPEAPRGRLQPPAHAPARALRSGTSSSPK